MRVIASDLAAHAATAGSISPEWVSYLAQAGRFLAVAGILYYTIKAVILMLAGIVAIFTRDEQRREACLEIVRTVSRGWPLPPRLPRSG
jgi:hypothetical protein